MICCTIISKATITTYSSQRLLTHNLELRHRPCLCVLGLIQLPRPSYISDKKLSLVSYFLVPQQFILTLFR